MKYLNNSVVGIATLLLLSSIQVLAAEQGQFFNKLVCQAGDGDSVIVTGVGTNKITVSAGFGPIVVTATDDGDCANRKTFCFEEGQWMINIPKSLMSGRKAKGHLWVNSDTDDRSENNQLGDRYECNAINE